MKVKLYKEKGFLTVAVLGSMGEFAFYLYKDNEVWERRSYTSSSADVFQISEQGTYQVKIFNVSKQGDKSREWSDRVVFDLEDLDLESGEARLPLLAGEWDLWVKALKSVDLVQAMPWYITDLDTFTADTIMTSGWCFDTYPSINPAKVVDWGAPGRKNRTWGFHLHAWEFIEPVLNEYLATGNLEMLQWMFDAANNWWSFARTSEDDNAMVWYDMALSLRTPRLLRLLIHLAKSDDSNRVQELLEPMVKHAEMLLTREAFNPNNNHGFFAAAASIELARVMPFLPAADILARTGEERMRTMVHTQFARDGGHLEHSPGYHRMLMSSFQKALEAGLITDWETGRRVKLAAAVFGWMIQPDGHLVQLGDTPDIEVDSAKYHSVDECTEFIISDGQRGTPNNDELLVLPDSGYVFIRSPQPQDPGQRAQSGYLAFQAGFHSRAHKHADDLTFTWFDKGYEILVDAGRYGYDQLLPPDAPERMQGFYYGAPERKYVESTVAHNTVQVDGKDIERRSREPYGSAVGECQNNDGRFVVRGSVDHESYVHKRTIIYEPGTYLEIVDNLIGKGIESTAISWFNINGDFEAVVEGNSVLFYAPKNEFAIRVSGGGILIPPVRGQKDPVRGWRSKVDRELIPTWNFGYSQPFQNGAQVVVKFEIIPASEKMQGR